MSQLLSILAARAARAPNDPTLHDGARWLGAGDLVDAVHGIANELVSRGIQRLAILAGNSPQLIIADLACQQADICTLILPDFFSDTQLQSSIKAAGAQTILTDDPARLNRIVTVHPRGVAPQALPGFKAYQIAAPNDSALPVGTRKITFTSGSTGTPRGVCLSARQQLDVARSVAAGAAVENPRHLCVLPLSTLLENIAGVYAPLLAGGTVSAPPLSAIGLTGSSGLDLSKLLEAIETQQPKSLILVPQMLRALVAALSAGWQPPASLEFVAVGGGRVSANLLLTAREAGLPVFEGYGLSEVASVACLNLPGKDLPGSVGRPLPHADVQVQDGEVVIRGCAFLGYLGEPSSWYPEQVRTGDLGHFDPEGYLHISGRRSSLLISDYGRNISPEWVESEVLSNPRIAQCVVFGDARPWCVALIYPADPALSDEPITRWLDQVNATLPDYARVRGWHRLIQPLSQANRLLTANGRPRRKAIYDCYGEAVASLYPDQRVANLQ